MNPGRRFLFALAVCSWLAACGDNDDDGGGGTADAAASIDGSSEQADASPTPDAMGADLSCLGDPLPTEAANPVALSGGVFTIDLDGQSPLEGAIVEVRRASNDRVLDDNAPGGTPADGTYSLTARTRGNPLLAYLHASADEVVPTRLYPPLPVTGDLTMIPIPTFSPLIVNFLSPDQDPENGIILIIVLDCSGQPVQGATVTSTPEAGAVVYADDTGVPDDAATATGAQGLAYLLNVPAGAVAVNATASGEALLEHEVSSVPDEITTTVVLPGPPSL